MPERTAPERPRGSLGTARTAAQILPPAGSPDTRPGKGAGRQHSAGQAHAGCHPGSTDQAATRANAEAQPSVPTEAGIPPAQNAPGVIRAAAITAKFAQRASVKTSGLAYTKVKLLARSAGQAARSGAQLTGRSARRIGNSRQYATTPTRATAKPTPPNTGASRSTPYFNANFNPEQPQSAGRFHTGPAIAVIAYPERGQQELTSNESDLLLTANRRDSYSTVDCNQSAAPAWFQVDWYRPRDKRCNATAGLTDITRQRQSGIYTTLLWANTSGCFGIDDAVLIQRGTNRPTGSHTGRSSNLRR